MPTLTHDRPTFPPGDESTAAADDDGIDVGRIITNPNWNRDARPASEETFSASAPLRSRARPPATHR